MYAGEALAQIKNTAFREGWTFTARPYYGDRIEVEFSIKTVDTSYPSADGICRIPKTIGDTVVVDVSDMDEAALAYQLLDIAAQTNTHEDREFLQIRQPDGSWVAPLHPHTDSGNDKWDRLSRTYSAGGTDRDRDAQLRALMAALAL